MAYWIIVVDDDTATLQMAGHILSKNDMRVTALRSGRSLLEHISVKGQPTLILLDINIPDMNGFEALSLLRQWENSTGREETPVIFLTADDDAATEQLGFEAGVADYIRKPFHPDVLLRRINNIVMRQNKINSLRAKATTDQLTGLLNKAAARTKFSQLCAERTGCLMMIDLDSFKLVNDIYGHEMGDKVLVSFSKLITGYVPKGSRCARIGGDEFAAFCPNMAHRLDVAALAEYLNAEMQAEAKRLMGSDMGIPLGASVGAVFVPEHGKNYEELLKRADKALYTVKQNGKHGYSIYSTEAAANQNTGIRSIETDLLTISTIVGERNIPNSAQRLDKALFSSVYQYIMRYIVRNRRKACKVLFNISSNAGTDNETYEELCTGFGEHIKNNLRKSDILMRNRYNQYFVLLADIHQSAVSTVIQNILNSWNARNGDAIQISYISEFVGGIYGYGEPTGEHRVLIAAANEDNLKTAGDVLSGDGFQVSLVNSGQAMFDLLEKQVPDLILLSTSLSDMEGFTAMKKLRAAGGDASDIPVIFLTGSNDPELIRTVLSLGALDLIGVPFSHDLLLNRANHAIELTMLRRKLSLEVEKNTRESKRDFRRVMGAFAALMDTKDVSKAEHTLRVADCAGEIARRAKLPAQQQTAVYMTALLQNIGTLPGENISIRNEPFAESAARIIALANAYVNMQSRFDTTQEQIRREITQQSGTRFDPFFVNILLGMLGDTSSDPVTET